jgi:hypothetical protein
MAILLNVSAHTVSRSAAVLSFIVTEVSSIGIAPFLICEERHVRYATVGSIYFTTSGEKMTTPEIWWTERKEPRTPQGSVRGEVFAWSDNKNNEWQICFDVAVRQGRRQAVGIHIVASPHNDNGLTSEAMRSLPFGALITEYLKHQANKRPAPATSEKVKGTKRGTPLDNEVLKTVADLYRHAVNNGISPTSHIAETMNISPSGAAKRIQAARQAAFLKPARRGKPGERENQ